MLPLLMDRNATVDLDALEPAERILWQFWIRAMEAAHELAPELLPYVVQLKPEKRVRLGRVLRLGLARHS